jgi:amidophosphoribosyltransferase
MGYVATDMTPDLRPDHLRDSGLAEDGSPREACGVFGIYAPGTAVAHLAFDGLYALQHRGQESAGMAATDGSGIMVVKDMGLVTNVFNEYKLAGLQGHLAIGHTRYSTTGTSTWHNAQPVYRVASPADEGSKPTEFALGHNGNLTNTAQLTSSAGMLPGTATSDSDVIAELIVRRLDSNSDEDLLDALKAVLPTLQGAFSLVLMDNERLIGIRDPRGFRPLCLGRVDTGWVLASETPALDITGAHFVRELDPGEVLVIDHDGPRSVEVWPASSIDPRLCLFEFVYLARPDSRLYGQELHSARIRMGELLADQSPVDADMVMGVPDSGLPAAEGYARRSGIRYGHGLVKNRYIGRTFIVPDQAQRAQGVRRKLNPLQSAIAGQRLIVVDDSIVRGTTTRAMVKMLREAGAAEVHLRISSPPYKWPCYYGLDTGTKAELIAANLTVSEITEYLGADSLAYLSLDALKKATGAPGAGFCDACLTGHYPPEVAVELVPRHKAGLPMTEAGSLVPEAGSPVREAGSPLRERGAASSDPAPSRAPLA